MPKYRCICYLFWNEISVVAVRAMGFAAFPFLRIMSFFVAMNILF